MFQVLLYLFLSFLAILDIFQPLLYIFEIVSFSLESFLQIMYCPNSLLRLTLIGFTCRLFEVKKMLQYYYIY